MLTLWNQKEPDTPSSCLWQLGPGAGQQSLAPKIVDLQQAMCREGWFEIVQDDSVESQQGQHILQTVLARMAVILPAARVPLFLCSVQACSSSYPSIREAVIPFPINSLFD